MAVLFALYALRKTDYRVYQKEQTIFRTKSSPLSIRNSAVPFEDPRHHGRFFYAQQKYAVRGILYMSLNYETLFLRSPLSEGGVGGVWHIRIAHLPKPLLREEGMLRSVS